MKFLYLIINIGSIAVPLAYSFEPKMKFIRYWKEITLSTSIIALPFLIWDALFTNLKIWGFNPDYLIGPHLLGMPLEEWLFFFCIPYASIFIHYALLYFKPNWIMPQKWAHILSLILIAISILVTISFYNKSYTVVNFTVFTCVLALGLAKRKRLLAQFYISFLFILIPFFIVNGILTGSGIESPIVWYNSNEFMGIRMLTIPIEDMAYAFSMLFTNIILFEYFKKRKNGHN